MLVVSPPASATPVSLARPARPECSRWAGSPCQLRGRATETTAAIGRPAIAAMSLRLTARDLRPTCSGVASGQVKCTPSTSMSTAISVESVSGQDTDAASSPMPTSSRGWGPACRRIQSIKANSPPGRSGDREAGEGCGVGTSRFQGIRSSSILSPRSAQRALDVTGRCPKRVLPSLSTQNFTGLNSRSSRWSSTQSTFSRLTIAHSCSPTRSSPWRMPFE